MPLSVYNTMTRRKEEFVPLIRKQVGIYVCGPTVYSHAHIGHAKSYVSFDVVVRYLRYLGNKVRYVQNITDVGHLTDDADEGEDKIEKQSKLDRMHPMELVDLYTRSYFEDMDRLGNLRPNISPRATQHIIEQIELVKSLLKKNFAYEVNGSVYFDVRRFRDYGKLSRRNLDEMEAGKRVEVKSEKRHSADFALWKKAEPGHIMQWSSPWGLGYPGWHAECSVMSMKYLGEQFDIHGGGIEIQFPHHECEIAQSECATGKQPFVKYWLHNNMVSVNGQKMSKSLGNFVTIKDAFKKWDPMVIRFFVMQSHYRSTLDFSEQALDAAKQGFERLAGSVNRYRSYLKNVETVAEGPGLVEPLLSLKQQFFDSLDDDFNTPQAIAVLFEVTKRTNEICEGRGQTRHPFNVREIERIFFTEGAGDVLGFDFSEKAPPSLGNDSELAKIVDLLIDLRAELRAHKLWALSDKIRTRLGEIGIVLEDKQEGTTWRKV
ncbi:MAG: cysteine--tRNA ligase [Bacteroidota bacterium]